MMIGLLLVKNPFIQTVIARLTTNYLENELKTTVKVARVEFNPLKRLAFKNLLILDQHNDTLLHAGELKINWKNLISEKFKFQPKLVVLNRAVVKIIRYPNEEVTNYHFLIDYFAKHDQALADTTDEAENPLIISLEGISISDCRFIFKDQNDTTSTEGINFKDIDLSVKELKVDDIAIKNDSVFGDICNLVISEKSGFSVKSLMGDFIFCPTLLQADGLYIKTENNEINVNLKFTYSSPASFNDFIHDIRIEADFDPTILNLKDIGFFAPVLFQMDNQINLEGSITGTVDNFKARDFKFSLGGDSYFNGNIQMNGLPDFFETYIHLSIIEFIVTTNDIASFNLPIKNNHIQIPDFLDKLGCIAIKGKFTGFYDDFVSYGDFTTDLGYLNTDLLLRVSDRGNINYKGKIASRDLQVGYLFNLEKYLNSLTFSTEITGQGVNFETMDVALNGLIQSIDFYGNTYQDIDISGSLSEKKFNGSVNVNDELIDLDFDGIIDYSQEIPNYKFTACITNAQPNKMNLIEKDSSLLLSTKIDINISGNQFDNLLGTILLDSTILIDNGKAYTMNDFSLSFVRNGTDDSRINLYSDLADVIMAGKFTFKEIPYIANEFINHYIDTLFADLPLRETIAGQDFSFEVKMNNPDPLTELIFPRMKMARGTLIKGWFKSDSNNLIFDFSSNEISYDGIRFCRVDAHSRIRNDDLVVKVFTDHLFVSDSLSLDSINSYFVAGEDSLLFDIEWNNKKSATSNYGALDGYFHFLSPRDMIFRMNDGWIVINDTIWKFEPSSYLSIDSTSIFFDKFGIASSNQWITINGKISHDPMDTLFLQFEKFNLSNVDQFLEKSGIDLDGYLNGNLSIANFYTTPNYLADLSVSELVFNKEKLGEALIKSDWIPHNQSFNVLAQIIYEGKFSKHKTLEISGTFYPNKKSDNFDIDIKLDNYKLYTLAPFIRDFSSKIEGMATGDLKLRGATQKPELKGSLNLKRTNLKIDYLNVIYSLAGKVNFDKNLIYYDSLLVYDSLNNQAIASGKIMHDYFSNFNLDLNFTAKNLAGLNTNRSQNESFYGTAFASGTVNITGPPDNLTMKLNMKSEKGTNIKIPASYGTEIGSSDFIVFVDKKKEIIEPESDYEVKINGITLDLGLIVTHDANIQLFLPYQMGNIQANGSGDIIMNIIPTGVMTMKGEYVINRGSFFLTLQNIINRDFNIRRGSKVTWTGDPFNAQIDLKAVYKVKTSLGEYGPPEDSASRVQVDCVIALSKSLYNPEIKFSIEFPELKDLEKQYIYSQLDTTDQAMMSQQMISLLLFNTFSYSTGATGSVGLNAFSILTNQLNNYLSGISDNIDIGLNYRPGEQLSSDEVDLALSTRLFDDRVIIDGNVGVRGKENTSNLIGEVTVEVKITDDGRFRAKVFNKSNNDDLYKNYAPYTQGIGVFYTQDFHRFRDIFKRKEKLY